MLKDMPEVLPLSGAILISELAWGDVEELINRYSSSDELQKLFGGASIVQMFDEVFVQALHAISVLHSLGVSHNDMHLGNFLIKESKKGKPRVLIHDFGKSVDVETWDADLILRDFYTLATRARDHPKLAQLSDQLDELIAFATNAKDANEVILQNFG